MYSIVRLSGVYFMLSLFMPMFESFDFPRHQSRFTWLNVNEWVSVSNDHSTQNYTYVLAQISPVSFIHQLVCHWPTFMILTYTSWPKWLTFQCQTLHINSKIFTIFLLGTLTYLTLAFSCYTPPPNHSYRSVPNFTCQPIRLWPIFNAFDSLAYF